MTIGWYIKKLFEKCGMILYLKKYDSDYTMLGFKNINFDMVIDIGANRGDYVKRFRLVFPQAEIYAFEPLPKIFNLLQQSIYDKKTHLYNLALAEKSGFAKFYYNLDFPGSSSFYKSADFSPRLWHKIVKRIKRIKVNTATLDSIMMDKIKLNQKILIKIDVEGYESKVIEGAKETLKLATACSIEIHFSNWYKEQPSFDKIYQMMKALGYEYRGNWDQVLLPSGTVGYIDAFFIKKDFINSPEYHKLQEQGLFYK